MCSWVSLSHGRCPGICVPWPGEMLFPAATKDRGTGPMIICLPRGFTRITKTTALGLQGVVSSVVQPQPEPQASCPGAPDTGQDIERRGAQREGAFPQAASVSTSTLWHLRVHLRSCSCRRPKAEAGAHAPERHSHIRPPFA